MSAKLSAANARLLADGVSISNLAVIFGKDKRTVSEKLRSLQASGTRQGYPIYRIDQAARFLMDPLINSEALGEYIRRVDPSELPPFLLKEFWAGQLSKQRFEANEADLWPTPDVRLAFIDVFEKLEAGIRGFTDTTIDAAAGLSDKQCGLLKELAGGLLVELKRTLVDGDIDIDAKLNPRRRKPVLESVDDDGL